jgi:hypothetical protein
MDANEKNTPETIGNQFGYLCPKCKQGDCLSVAATVWVGFEPYGTDALDSNHEWGQESGAYCSNCDWHGVVSELERAENFEDE